MAITVKGKVMQYIIRVPQKTQYLVYKSHAEDYRCNGCGRRDDRCSCIAKAGGEGSRGGNIVGHTASGNPVYGSKRSSTFTNHGDGTTGVRFHEGTDNVGRYHDAGTHHYDKGQAAQAKKDADEWSAGKHDFENKWSAKAKFKRDTEKSVSGTLDDLIKGGGEGSKGGNVIGHTRSGKPIYAGGNDHAGFSKEDHTDAHALHLSRSLEFGRKTKTAEAHRNIAGDHSDKLRGLSLAQGQVKAHVEKHNLKEGPSRGDELSAQREVTDKNRAAKVEMMARRGDHFKSVDSALDDLIKAGA